MNQTTQTQISYKKKYRFATKKKSDMQKAKKHRFAYQKKKKKKKNSNLHDTGEDLQNFCMTGPSSRDLYKTNPDLQGLEKKKKKKKTDQQTQIAICSGETLIFATATGPTGEGEEQHLTEGIEP